MGILLVFALALTGQHVDAAADKHKVSNVKSLVNGDLWEVQKGGRFRILSLKAGSSWEVGTAWLVDPFGRTGSSLQAFQGKFVFYNDKLDDDTLLLHLSFPRKYKATSDGGRLTWEMDTGYSQDASGVVVEIPLTDRRVTPPPVSFVVTEAFLVDRSGLRTQRFSGGGFLSRGSEVEASTRAHLKVGETLRLTNDAIDYETFRSSFLSQLRDSPPPGYRFRLTSKEPSPVVLGVEAGRGGKFEQAIQSFTDAITANPNDARALWNRAYVYEKSGKHREAIADYTAVTVLAAERWQSFNAAAWLLATSPQTGCRDGMRAFSLAKKACELTEFKDWTCLDTIAAAYAAAGDFAKAAAWEQKALDLGNALTAADSEGCLKRLRLYKLSKPYVEGGATVSETKVTAGGGR